MTPGLAITGRADLAEAKLSRTDVRDWLARAAVWFETVGDAVLDAQLGRDADERPVLYVAFHPVAEDVEVRFTSSGVVRVVAQTWPAGPGYHAYLCGVLAAFAEDFGIEWDHADDSTGFFRAGDLTKLGHHFLAHLWRACGDFTAPLALGLPTDHGFTHSGPVLTPTGPRSREWLAAVSADPAAGRDFFPWWNIDLDAAFYRNRALALLWCEFPWRPPLTDDEGELTDEIAADLEMAHSLDPAGNLPWREWAELLGIIEADRDGRTVQGIEPELKTEVLRRAAAIPEAPALGYRRLPVRVSVGGDWSMEIPGTFAEGVSEDGRTWYGWDGQRRIMAQLGRPDAPRHPVPEETQDALGRTMWRLSGVVSAGGETLTCQIEIRDPEDRGWAAEAWRSLRHEGARANARVG